MKNMGKKKIVVLGGGTGQGNLLRGLKQEELTKSFVLFQNARQRIYMSATLGEGKWQPRHPPPIASKCALRCLEAATRFCRRFSRFQIRARPVSGCRLAFLG